MFVFVIHKSTDELERGIAKFIFNAHTGAILVRAFDRLNKNNSN